MESSDKTCLHQKSDQLSNVPNGYLCSIRWIQWLSYYLKVGGYDEAMGLCALDEERRAVRLAADASAATAELSVAEYKATALF